MFVMPYTVHLSDTDTTSQVYYARPLEWLEWCRVDWFNKSFGNFMQFVESSGITFFPSQAHIEYKRPVLFGDQLTIEMAARDIKKVSFVLDYTVKRGDEIVIRSEITIVSFDVRKKALARLSEEVLRVLGTM
jgi:acyl-CoA thioester hydrolase